QVQYVNLPNISYRLQFTVDGVSGSASGATQGSGSYPYTECGWYASPGQHSVQVTVDADNTIAETDETNNTKSFSFSPIAPTTLPQKLLNPMGGVPFHDWVFFNYVDVDPTGGVADFRGGPFTY